MGRRRSSGGGLGIIVILLIGLLIPVFKFVAEHGVAIAIIAGAVLVIWLVFKAMSGKESTADSEVPETDRLPQDVGWPTQSGQRRTYALPKRARLSTDGDEFWVPNGRNAEVAGYQLGSMLYVGRKLADAGNTGQPEPALIDPALSIDRSVIDCSTRRLNYWPSYSAASSEARAAYLNWLRGGRRDSGADVGYVFLYFYGLERRLLHDGLTSTIAAAEAPTIENEVARLLHLYGGNRSFERYAGAFLDFLQAKKLPAKLYESEPEGRTGRALGFCHRLALAQCAAEGKPLPPTWAHFWVTSHGAAALGAASRRCPTEFKTLFETKYRTQFGEGLVLPRNRTQLKLEYQPASASFRGATYSASNNPLLTELALPDVSVLSSPIKKLEAIAQEACKELGRYGRIVAKDPAAAASFEALVELPIALWPKQYREPLLAVRDTVDRAGQPAAIPLEKFRAWIPDIANLTRSKFKALARALSSAGLGMEPDIRFGGSVPAVDSRLVLFADDPNTTVSEPSPRYSAAALTLHLASAVITADGDVAEVEKGLLRRQLEEWLHLTESERRRLHARLRFLLSEPPKLSGIKSRIETLDQVSREALGDFLAVVAQADARVTPQEIKSLQKIFKLLGLDPEGVFSRVHVAAVAATATIEPVTVRPSAARIDQDPQTSGYAIPRPPQRVAAGSQASGITLDAVKVAALQKDSERVAAILASVFEEPASEPTDPGAQDVADAGDAENEAPEPGLLGLDPIHSVLLETLLTRTHWSRAELEELAADRELMLDGALEHINEASFETLDMAIIEDGDPIALNPEAVREISGDHLTESNHQTA